MIADSSVPSLWSLPSVNNIRRPFEKRQHFFCDRPKHNPPSMVTIAQVDGVLFVLGIHVMGWSIRSNLGIFKHWIKQCMHPRGITMDCLSLDSKVILFFGPSGSRRAHAADSVFSPYSMSPP